MKSCIQTIGGLTINLAEVKCFKIETNNPYKNSLTVEFKTRYGYIHNPITDERELQEYNESTEMEFHSYESAVQHRNEWVEVWEEYLKNVE